VPSVGVLGLGQGVIGERVRQGLRVWAPQAWGTELYDIYCTTSTKIVPIYCSAPRWGLWTERRRAGAFRNPAWVRPADASRAAAARVEVGTERAAKADASSTA
jgi:hypothetical protein